MDSGGSAGDAASSLIATLEDPPPWPPSARCLQSSPDLSYVVATWWFKSSEENVADVCRFSFQELSDHVWNVTVVDVKAGLLELLKQT